MKKKNKEDVKVLFIFLRVLEKRVDLFPLWITLSVHLYLRKVEVGFPSSSIRISDPYRCMKIGLLFGSFNPPHSGHLALAKKVKEEVDEVWFIPAMQNPGKKEKAVDIDLRIEMLKTFGFPVSDIEKEMGEDPHYTYDVLKELQERYPGNELMIVCGEDVDPESWRNGEELVKEFGILRFPRIFGLSSTQLREKIKSGESLDGICSLEIEKIIRKNNLYSL